MQYIEQMNFDELLLLILFYLIGLNEVQVSFSDIYSSLHHFEFVAVLKYSYLASHRKESCNNPAEMSRRCGCDVQWSQLINNSYCH